MTTWTDTTKSGVSTVGQKLSINGTDNLLISGTDNLLLDNSETLTGLTTWSNTSKS